ncbi:hypothetical protein SAMN02910456_01849 [Ruminococcaceae bacterium YRB3002]|nr:hypothetical protein SAMN02910456_01849 [Ruminococcaceae bacterium YRB3002]
MGLWILFLAFMFIGGTAAIIYLVTRFHRFSFIRNIPNKFVSWFVACIPVLLMASVAFYEMYTMIVIMLHCALFFILSDVILAIWRRASGKSPKSEGRYWGGVAALAATALFMTGAWFAAYHISRTYYEFNTVKNVGDIRVAMFADSHLGVTLSGERFAEQMERIDAENADVVIICGDFVDDDANRHDMEVACAALGRMKTPVYYVYGNHDRGYYDYREFTGYELAECLKANGVTILQDSSELIDGRFYLVGREDRSRDRDTVEELLSPLDHSRYIISCDHQPGEFDIEASCGADLVLSGHTHGGHVWPSGYFAYWNGTNDGIWGLYDHGDTHCIVTSGISGWAIPFKTGTYSEYVIIDIHGK